MGNDGFVLVLVLELVLENSRSCRGCIKTAEYDDENDDEDDESAATTLVLLLVLANPNFIENEGRASSTTTRTIRKMTTTRGEVPAAPDTSERTH